MATSFKNSLIKNIGPAPVKALETQINTRATIIGLSLTNLTPGIVYVSVELQDDTSTRGYYCKDVILAPNTSLRIVNGGEKLILGNSNELYISCDTVNGIDALVSYVEII